MFCALALLAALNFGFRRPPAADPLKDDDLSAIRSRYADEARDFAAAAEQFAGLCESAGPEDAALLRGAFAGLRQQYKPFEYLAAYLAPDVVDAQLNGPPIQRFDGSTRRRAVLPPKGLQWLGRMVCAPGDDFDPQSILGVSARLALEAKAFAKGPAKLDSGELTHAQVFAAMRQALRRMFAEGLAGTDAPGCKDAVIAENRIVLESLRRAYGHYAARIGDKDARLRARLETTFDGALAYLDQNRDFETFDRAAFTRIYLQALYGDLGAARAALGVSADKNKSPLNSDSRGFFSETFLDAGYFAGLGGGDEQRNAQAELGRVLFFDPILSDGAERSCASCHRANHAFANENQTDDALLFSKFVSRNTPGLLHSAYATRYMRDLRLFDLKKILEHAPAGTSPEAGSFAKHVGRLAESPEYQKLFADAFGEETENETALINEKTAGQALAAYLATLTAWDTPFDQYMRGDRAELAPDALRGYNLFMGKAGCATCHAPPTFGGLAAPDYAYTQSAVTGAPAAPGSDRPDGDPGEYGGPLPVTESMAKGAFKVPGLRNLRHTAPYMHHGVFATLEEVLAFYNAGGGPAFNKHYAVKPLGLSAEEQQAIIAFLLTLDDVSAAKTAPTQLPQFPVGSAAAEWNGRKIEGAY